MGGINWNSMIWEYRFTGMSFILYLFLFVIILGLCIFFIFRMEMVLFNIYFVVFVWRNEINYKVIRIVYSRVSI